MSARKAKHDAAASEETAGSRLTTGQRRGLWLLLLLFIAFGGVVEYRSAFLHTRMGDLDVFLRAAWAVRTRHDPYQVTDDKGFHYHYPPLLAILLTPFADPPPYAAPVAAVPYSLTVVCWYLLSLGCLAMAVHGLAAALEAQGETPSPAAWWSLRVAAVLGCLPPIGHTLMRGQVNLLLLLLLAGAVAALLRGRSFWSGWWLAGAVCLKVIPAFLIIYPLSRRDGRCLAGCALGLVTGMAIVPALVLGPGHALAYFEEWADVLVKPGLGAGNDSTRAKELTEVTATDSQSFQAVIHNTIHYERGSRPHQISSAIRGIHWLLGGLLTLVTLLAARGGRGEGVGMALTWGCLVMVMLLVSPVAHLHYFCLAMPLIMAILVAAPTAPGSPARMAMATLLLVNIVGNLLPQIPAFNVLRECGGATYPALVLWAVGVTLLARRDSGAATMRRRRRLSAAA